MAGRSSNPRVPRLKAPEPVARCTSADCPFRPNCKRQRIPPRKKRDPIVCMHDTEGYATELCSKFIARKNRELPL